jgi:hypothetical protein
MVGIAFLVVDQDRKDPVQFPVFTQKTPIVQKARVEVPDPHFVFPLVEWVNLLLLQEKTGSDKVFSLSGPEEPSEAIAAADLALGLGAVMVSCRRGPPARRER